MSGHLVDEWMEKAEYDYEAALSLHRKRGKPVYGIVCFHAQQCAEKYLKAFLSLVKRSFPRTHDLVSLREEAAKESGTFALIQDVLKILDAYAVEVRYPGDEPDKKEADRDVKAMKKVRTFVRGKLKGI